ncbi:MAG: lipoate--protein ligase family protein [Paludibacter sp.]|nr:lipoate--protein ligase family protein [Paludibacter sp.]
MNLLYSSSTSPTFNLAAEEFLFSQSQNDYLFLYVNKESVIIGSNQVLHNEVNIDFCNANDIQIVRRLSGGGAVYHDQGNLNFSFISNKEVNRSALGSDFLIPVVEVLKSLSVKVEIGARKDLWLPGGFKISGTASHVTKNRELHHGTILYNSDLSKLQQSLSVVDKDISAKGIASVRSTVKNIKSYLIEQNQPEQSPYLFFHQIKNKFLELFEFDDLEKFLSDEIIQIELLEQKYKSIEWTYRK